MVYVARNHSVSMSDYETVRADRPLGQINPFGKRGVMLYAILAYHVETKVMSCTPQHDAAVMANLSRVHELLNQNGRLGPVARLATTRTAHTLRGPRAGTVLDGPFAETKEQLLGFYIIDFDNDDAAIAAARELRRANPSAVYEMRPVALFLPGAAIPQGEPIEMTPPTG